MTEVRNATEGTLAWVQGSGVGTAWATASGASGRVFAYVRDDTHTSGQTIQTIMERGIPNHHKFVSKEPITKTFTVAWGITANYPTMASGSGATVPNILIEYRATAKEDGSGYYTQYYGCALQSMTWTEGAPESTQQFQFVALGMSGVNTSGYLV